MRLALDTNVLLLLVVGLATNAVNHARLSAYEWSDYNALLAYLDEFEGLVVTPNIWTEVSNLSMYRVERDWRRNIALTTRDLVDTALEVSLPTRDLTHDPDFERLDVGDCSVPALLADDPSVELLTDDVAVRDYALSRGYRAKNFIELRDLT